MNWKLIFGLSLFGIVMAFSTYVMEFSFELLCFLVLYLAYAFIIAKNAQGKYFLHGFAVSTIGCLFMTVTNMAYSLLISSAYNFNPYWPVMVLILGIALGGFSFVGGKIVRRRIA
jgi:hypothetical protein